MYICNLCIYCIYILYIYWCIYICINTDNAHMHTRYSCTKAFHIQDHHVIETLNPKP
jgi:hypothetical protein